MIQESPPRMHRPSGFCSHHTVHRHKDTGDCLPGSSHITDVYMVLSSGCGCSVTQSCLTLCNPMDCNTPGLPVHHHLPELAQTLVHRVHDAIQPSHPLSSPSPPAFNLSQHRGVFQIVGSLHQVAKGLEFQLQPQSFQQIFRTDFF